jgi:hypothetical protein
MLIEMLVSCLLPSIRVRLCSCKKHPAGGSSEQKKWIRMLAADGRCNPDFILLSDDKVSLPGCRST